MNGILGEILLGQWELGETSSPVVTGSSAGGRTACKGFAVAALVVSALGIVHTSGGAVKAVSIRVTQVVVEAVYEQTANANILVTQEVAEVVYEQATNAILRVTQVAVEVLTEEFQALGIVHTSGGAVKAVSIRVTQVVVEAVYEQTANANILVTQEVAEVVYAFGRTAGR